MEADWTPYRWVLSLLISCPLRCRYLSSIYSGTATAMDSSNIQVHFSHLWPLAWQVYDVWRNVDRIPFLALHKKYGSIVRLGPNKLSFSSPKAIKDIYSLLQKSDMHLVAQQISNGTAFPLLFANTDTQWHNTLRRQVNSAFNMTTIVQYCCEYAAFRLLFAGPYTSAMQRTAEWYQLDRASWTVWHRYDDLSIKVSLCL